MPQAVSGKTGRQQLIGNGRRRSIEKDRDMMIIAQLACGDEGAQVDGVQCPDIEQIKHQAQRPFAPDRLDDGAPQVNRILRVQVTTRMDDECAVRSGIDGDRGTGHRVAFRNLTFSATSG
jgi:hypothetical protein